MARRKAVVAGAVLALLFAAGCRHLTTEAKAVLKQAQLVMEERALAVDAFKGSIKAKDAKEQAATERYLAAHAKQLMVNAAEMADLVTATDKGAATDVVVTLLANLHVRAVATAENWKAAMPRIESNGGDPATFQAWCAGHAEALDGLAAMLGQIRATVEPERPK